LLLVEELTGVLIHPFEGELTWEGHKTVVHELHEDLDGHAPDAIVTVCGGGGLLQGILLGLEDVGWEKKVPVVVAETAGAESLATSLKSGKLVTLPGISSIAKSLGATTVSKGMFENCTVRVYRQDFAIEDAIGSHACLLEA
jgi:L-serine/L-threonine ammonia-lyase